MDAGDIDRLERHDWIPESDKARLRELMKEWSRPGRGYIFIAVPPGPGREAYTIFQPMVDPEYQDSLEGH